MDFCLNTKASIRLSFNKFLSFKKSYNVFFKLSKKTKINKTKYEQKKE